MFLPRAQQRPPSKNNLRLACASAALVPSLRPSLGRTLGPSLRRALCLSLCLSLWVPLWLVLWLSLDTQTARSEEPSGEDATALIRQAHLNLYYAGDDAVVRVSMAITDKRGKSRQREFVMLRKDLEEGGAQRYYVYFLKPADVQRTSFMAWKNPEADDSRWIFIPSLDLVKPISSNDKKSSFVGSDFSYEDVSGRHWSEDAHVILRAEALQGVDCWVIESRPKQRDSFNRKLTWIEKARLLPLREEYFEEDAEPSKVFEILEVREIEGIPTAMKRQMTIPRKETRTLVEFTSVDYNVGLKDEFFTERFLKSPPPELVRP